MNRRAIVTLIVGAATLPPAIAPTAHAAEPRQLVVGTPDPALVAALAAFFAPRGIDVVPSPWPLRKPADAATVDGAVSRVRKTTDVVWLCDPGSGQRALCVRPQGQSVIVRRLALPAPIAGAALTPPDAAAVALSVQVVLLREDAADAPATVVAQLDDVAAPKKKAPTDVRQPPALTVELTAGAQAATTGDGFRGGFNAAYAPPFLQRHLGLGAGLSLGPSNESSPPESSRAGPPPPAATQSDLTVRLFARGQVDVWRLRLQLDLGPTGHVVTSQLPTPPPTSALTRRSLDYAVDAVIGAVVPFDRFFAGARAGLSYSLTKPDTLSRMDSSRWGALAVAVLGVGFL
jgi:hypothetical protein